MKAFLEVQIRRADVTYTRGITVEGGREIVLHYEIPRYLSFVMLDHAMTEVISDDPLFRKLSSQEGVHRIAYIGDPRASDEGITELAVSLLHKLQQALSTPRLARS